MNQKTKYLVHGAIIAALYAVLTMVLWQFSSLAIQVRLSEAMCVLPLFTPAAIPGLFIGCMISNLLSGTWIDVVFGSLATLIAAALTYIIGKKCSLSKSNSLSRRRKLLSPLPAVLVNAIVIPLVLFYGYGVTAMGNVTSTIGVLGLLALSILIGQALACYIIGMPLLHVLEKLNKQHSIF